MRVAVSSREPRPAARYAPGAALAVLEGLERSFRPLQGDESYCVGFDVKQHLKPVSKKRNAFCTE